VRRRVFSAGDGDRQSGRIAGGMASVAGVQRHAACRAAHFRGAMAKWAKVIKVAGIAIQ
jgi:hypothetical protein